MAPPTRRDCRAQPGDRGLCRAIDAECGPASVTPGVSPPKRPHSALGSARSSQAPTTPTPRAMLDTRPRTGSHVFYRKLNRALSRISFAGMAATSDDRGRPPVPGRCRRRLRGQPGPWGSSAIAEAVASQAQNLAYVNGTAFTHDSRGGIRRRAGARSAPVIWTWSTRWAAAPRRWRRRSSSRGSTGSSRVSRARRKMLSLAPCYHGNTLLALSASARAHYTTYFREWLVTVVRVPAPYAYRCACRGRRRSVPRAAASAIEEAIVREGPDTVAAFIARAGGRLLHRRVGARTGVLARGCARSATGTRCCSSPTRFSPAPAGPAPGRLSSPMASCPTS